MDKFPVLIPVLALVHALTGTAATISGQSIVPGKSMELRLPVPKSSADYAAQGGNPRPTAARAVWIFPTNFDPARRWPILIVTSTMEGHRSSLEDLPFYSGATMHEGWIVLATDADVRPRNDTEAWRLSMLGVALDALHREWPHSVEWPVAFAGLSGGAKRAGFVAAMLASMNSLRICGFFLCGINDDRISVAYRQFRPPPGFLDIPIWISSGLTDPIAPPLAQLRVESSLKLTGFKRVRLETFDGRHQVKMAEVQRALHWFREQGNF